LAELTDDEPSCELENSLLSLFCSRRRGDDLSREINREKTIELLHSFSSQDRNIIYILL
jgi:hypothetical protein